MKKATRTDTKLHNRGLVLQTIYDQNPISRAEIARLTHLTATTVSNVVLDLMAEGLVQEVGSVPSGRGKPPTLLALTDNAFHVIGIDLGRRVFQGAIINLRGKIIHRVSMASDGLTGDDALALVFNLLDQLQAQAQRNLLGIGIGAPGLIDPDRGILQKTVNFSWYNLPLQTLIQERYQIPVRIANDCHLAVLAEYRFGRYKNCPNLALVRMGHGIGAGIMLNGQLIHGQGFGAGEIGHIALVANGDLCSCGNIGCLETVASSRAIVKKAKGFLNGQNGGPPIEVDIDVVLQAVANGDPRLAPIVQEVGHYIGVALAQMVGILNIPYILLGGSVAQFGKPLLELIRLEMRQRLLPELVDQVEITISNLEPDIVLLGSAALLLKHELGLV